MHGNSTPRGSQARNQDPESAPRSAQARRRRSGPSLTNRSCLVFAKFAHSVVAIAQLLSSTRLQGLFRLASVRIVCPLRRFSWRASTQRRPQRTLLSRSPHAGATRASAREPRTMRRTLPPAVRAAATRRLLWDQGAHHGESLLRPCLARAWRARLPILRVPCSMDLLSCCAAFRSR
jgi:hypothetical protein